MYVLLKYTTTTTKGKIPIPISMPISAEINNLYPKSFNSKKINPQIPDAIHDSKQNIIEQISIKIILEITNCVDVIGIAFRFLKVSLSLSSKKIIAASIPNIQGSKNCIPYTITISNKESNASFWLEYSPEINCSFTIKVSAIGKSKENITPIGINFFLFNFKNSHLTSLSNSSTPSYSLEIIFKSVLFHPYFFYSNPFIHKLSNQLWNN